MKSHNLRHNIPRRLIAFFALTGSFCISSGGALADGQETWADRITVGGDIRFRHERIDLDVPGRSVRTRQRIRARLSIDSVLEDSLSAHLRLASGGSDPVSRNQTLGDGFSTKDFGLERAYIQFKPEECGANLLLGKMEQPFIVIEDLIWDSDLNPEGGALQYTLGLGDGVDLIATTSGFWAEERSNNSDTLMFGGQLATDITLDGDINILAGGGYYYWDNTQGYSTIYDSSDGFGNTVAEASDGSLLYASDFGVLNFFTKVGFDVGVPVATYFDYILNTEAEDVITKEDQGWMAGLTIGKAKKSGSWQFDYNYREVEADATLGIFTDSDSGGGGTDISGHRISGKYQITNQLQSAVTLFVNSLGIASGGSDTDYNRVQVDLIAKM